MSGKNPACTGRRYYGRINEGTKNMKETPQPKNTGSSTRRAFLKTTALTASAAALRAANVHRFGYAAGSDEIKIGLIGCGGRGSGAANDAMDADPGVILVAMTDIFPERLEKSLQGLMDRKPGQCRVDKDHCFIGFDGYKKVIESGVDVVLIACTSIFHPQYLKAAIDAGKHAFAEKPHAIDPPGVRLARETFDLAKQKKLSVVSGLIYRYVPAFRETIQRVHDGAIGDILAIEVNYLRTPYVLAPRQPDDTEIQYQFRNWYHFSWLSGDDILQSLVHNLDKAMWALHEEIPVKAHGLGGRSAAFGSIYGNVFDHYSVVYEYADGRKIYGFGRTQENCHTGTSDILIGTKGRCRLMEGIIEGETNWKYEGIERNGYKVEHEELFKAIRSGTPLVNDYGVNSSMMAILGQMAVYSGQQITWDDAYKSDFRFGPPAGDFTTEPPVRPAADGTYPVPEPGRYKVL
ncbi:MAG TPA: Gfo/Idh/MocA family oxidoreductase [bacterium]|nr:Gfo/Idh/MocA family oxidoreductase [Candidatus Omnitrophota bacterium]HOJ62140.1 Gfo/Idh/MocA family oxidoreductase [bacterium]HOL94600.1 Gfo/Idh/MocA family oxidoreductase [bacterium]HPP01360.1 Gfo/Idh/MocA family oxidoreductase [bacterium]HXK94674.1 Gfo/Idh/MocA family oxidoreductase [bacterium]